MFIIMLTDCSQFCRANIVVVSFVSMYKKAWGNSNVVLISTIPSLTIIAKDFFLSYT